MLQLFLSPSLLALTKTVSESVVFTQTLSKTRGLVKSVSQGLSFSQDVEETGNAMPITTRLEGTVLVLGDGESQSIDLDIGNDIVSTLTVTGRYLGQSDLPVVQLRDSGGNVLQTKTMSVIADIHEQITFNPQRGVYYIVFTNPGAGTAEFTAKLEWSATSKLRQQLKVGFK